jgi:hypothetical protein
MEESVKPSTKEPKATMTPEQRKAKKEKLHRLIMEGIKKMGPETLANKKA